MSDVRALLSCMKTCSECGNDHVARVLIGMPDLAWLEKQTEEYILDGCIVEGEPLPWAASTATRASGDRGGSVSRRRVTGQDENVNTNVGGQ